MMHRLTNLMLLPDSRSIGPAFWLPLDMSLAIFHGFDKSRCFPAILGPVICRFVALFWQKLADFCSDLPPKTNPVSLLH